MKETYEKCRQPLILRYHRLLEVFSKSDDTRDFFLDKVEGFLVYFDLDKSEEELKSADEELKADPDRYCAIPKLTYYEIRKFMEGFVSEKVYDIDTKEKLLEIISSRGARENFLEFVFDHLTELDKWQQYYQERSRIRIIEWLRDHEIYFVFEEDLDLGKAMIEKLKEYKFTARTPRDVGAARDQLENKSKSYYSQEALNPRPKRGRPPKQQAKKEEEPELADDFYVTVPAALRPFVYSPEYSDSDAAATFSANFNAKSKLLGSMQGTKDRPVSTKLHDLSQRLESLQKLSRSLKSMDVKEAEDVDGEKTISADVEQKKEKSSLASLLRGVVPKKRAKKGIKEQAIERDKKLKQVTRIDKKNKDK